MNAVRPEGVQAAMTALKDEYPVDHSFIESYIAQLEQAAAWHDVHTCPDKQEALFSYKGKSVNQGIWSKKHAQYFDMMGNDWDATHYCLLPTPPAEATSERVGE